MNIFLVRHGESVGNQRGLLYGHTDHPLTEQGVRDAAAVGEKLREADIRRCYSSPLSRAAETARLCTQGRDIETVYRDGLKEQYMGDWEDVSFLGMREAEPELIGSMIQDWTKVVPPGGESYEAVIERAGAVLDEILERGEDALIVAHNGPLAALVARLLSGGADMVRRLWLMHGCYTCVELQNGLAYLRYFNK